MEVGLSASCKGLLHRVGPCSQTVKSRFYPRANGPPVRAKEPRALYPNHFAIVNGPMRMMKVEKDN